MEEPTRVALRTAANEETQDKVTYEQSLGQ